MRLLKLLAIADRESVRVTGRSITGDRHVAMEHGHILSNIYNLIQLKHRDKAQWAAWFVNDGRDVVLANDPGDGQLSIYDVELLASTEAKFRDFTTKQLRDYSHGLADWKKNEPVPGGHNPISAEDTIDAVGLSGKKAVILAEASAERAVRDILSKFQ